MNIQRKIVNISIGILLCLLCLSINVNAQATVIMTFDDGWLGVSQYALPVLNANSQKGVAFINIDPVMGAGYTDYMKKAQLNSLYSAGWDISSHTISHTVLTNFSTRPEELKTELLGSRQWLVSNGYPLSSMFLAYPEGKYDSTIIAAVKQYGYVAARSVDVLNGTYPQYSPETITDAKYTMKTFEVDCSTVNSGLCTAADVIQQINNTNNSNGLLILTFHKIVPTLSTGNDAAGNPLSSTEFLQSDLQNVSDYIVAMNGSVEVKTLSQYFVTTAPTYAPPPSPTGLTETSGPNWINLIWTSGGGTTTAYNLVINGTTLFTGTTNTSYNLTSAVAGVNYHVQVYAVANLSVNQVPAEINATIQTYIPPTPVNIMYNYTMEIKTGSILVQWQKGTDVNVTNSFNVKIGNTWAINGTTNLSYNITNAVPGVIYPVEVYAVNTTNANTMSLNSAKASAIIPLFTPPVPEWDNLTTGNFWTNFSWKLNSTGGNNTDFYNYSVSINNVASSWNNTNNTFVNVTTLPHADVGILIYAVNKTNGGGQSEPLYMNMTMLNNEIEIYDGIWADYDVYVGDTLTVQPIFRNLDNDTIVFSANTTNATGNVSINKTTGQFIYITNSTSDAGKIYHWSITGNDGISVETIKFNVSIINRPVHLSAKGVDRGNSISSGGGGMVDVDDPNILLFERLYSQIRNGIESNVTFTKNKLISNVKFTGVKNYGEVKVKISVLKGNPTNHYICDLCSFFMITLDNMQSINEHLYITNNTPITFNINKSNLSDGVKVKLFRLNNETWQSIEIEDTNTETNDSKVFKANTHGFSLFTIILEPKNETTYKTINSELINQEISSYASTTSQKFEKAKESLYKVIISLIKKYMWWI